MVEATNPPVVQADLVPQPPARSSGQAYPMLSPRRAAGRSALRREAGDEKGRGRFLAQLAESLQAGGARQAAVRLVLSRYRGTDPTLIRVQARPVLIRGETHLSFVRHHRTRDITRNLPLALALVEVRELLRQDFGQANLLTAGKDIQLAIGKRGNTQLRTAIRCLPHAEAASRAGAQRHTDAARYTEAAPCLEAARLAEPASHNRAKRRPLPITRPFLQALGLTDAQQRLLPSMSRKWKQVNRFIEVFDNAWQASGLGTHERVVRLVDFGSGRGYLTFALHDHLRHALGVDARMTGVELRDDLVAASNAVVKTLGLEELSFRQGGIAAWDAADPARDRLAARTQERSEYRPEQGSGDRPAQRSGGASPPALDVLIALHACDTATDDAIHLGIRSGAAIVMCAPCCHKELRPQLLSPHPLRPILRHGVHLGQEAEMLTDGLRALLLEACGYDAQVFEFISLEHTSKNKMVLAVKRPSRPDPEPVLAQVAQLKAFYGIREQRLQSLLVGNGLLPAVPTAAQAVLPGMPRPAPG